MHSVFDRMLSSCQVRISQWMHTLGLPVYQRALVRKRCHIISLSGSKGTGTHNHLICKQTLNHFVKLPNDWAEWWVLICKMYLTLCYHHATYAIQTESTVYICLIIKKLYPQNRRDIRLFSDSNGTRTYNRIVRNGTLNHLANRKKWLSWVLRIYMHGVFDRMLSSCQVHISQWIHTLSLLEYQRTPFRKRRDIISLSDSKVTRIHNHLVRTRPLHHLVKLTKWLSWVVSAYL